ncbi:MAG: trigger factor family protein [Clostridia bacterium]|nr:trigger factor family protein [Clostridia bacterium]
MLVNVEKIDEQYLKCIFNVPDKEFKDAVKTVFMKTRDKYKIPGMETGKIPRPTIESYYGETVFYEDTINYLIREEFEKMNSKYAKYSITEDKVKDINIVQLEKNKEVIFEIIINYKGEKK